MKVPSASCTKAARRPLAFGWTSKRLKGSPSPRGGYGRACLGEGTPVPRHYDLSPLVPEGELCKIIKIQTLEMAHLGSTLVEGP